MKMLDLFSNRELALGLYALIFIVWLLCSRKIRPSTISIIKSACHRQLIIPFFFMLCYAGAAIYGLSCLSFWKWQYLKDIVMWVLFAGVPICFNAVNTKEERYFRNIVIDNLKFTALVEFLFGTFTFSFIGELIVQPVILLLFLLQAVAEKEKECRAFKQFLDAVIAISGILLIYFTIKEAIISYIYLNVLDLLVSFLIPIVFSALYLPIAYLFAVYAKYQVLFVRMAFKSPKSKKLKRKHRWKILVACGLSYKEICRFEKEYVKRLYVSLPESEFTKLIQEFKAGRSI